MCSGNTDPLFCRYEALISGTAQPGEVPVASTSTQANSSVHPSVSTLCINPDEFSGVESGTEDELDMDMITVPDTLVVPDELHI